MTEYPDGFASASPETLLAIRSNLLRGLDRVAASLDDGTFHTVGEKGSAPPSQSGHLTLWFLQALDETLAKKGGKDAAQT